MPDGFRAMSQIRSIVLSLALGAATVTCGSSVQSTCDEDGPCACEIAADCTGAGVDLAECAVLACVEAKCTTRPTVEGTLCTTGACDGAGTCVNDSATGGGGPGQVANRRLAVGQEHSCVVRDGGTMRCWGNNLAGQLGNGATGYQNPTPLEVSDLTDAVSTTATFGSTCAVTDSGGIRCWGVNTNGQLGNGANENQLAPVSVADIDTATGVTGGGSHACAVLADGSVRCWGDNGQGQLGNGTTTPGSNVPVPIMPLSGLVVETALGSHHTCALTESGSVSCWGRNDDGQLGSGTSANSPVPQIVPGVTANHIVAGGRLTCAVVPGGSVRCWGSEFCYFSSTTPVEMPGLASVRQLAIGETHTCALLTDGTVACRGCNFAGELGSGTGESAETPVPVVGLTDVVEVGAGREHSCALRADDSVWCWGNNQGGQLGNGTTANASVPVMVVGL
jgi:Regulator of chromosome condensation (RCC1) repeat